MITQLTSKLHEALRSVLPIFLIVTAAAFTIAPVRTDVMLSYCIGAVMLVVGLGFFTFGSENSMTLIGTAIGAKLTTTRRLSVILALNFILGILITMAEPDLQVLAGNVPHINSLVLVLTVSCGVGLFLMLSMIRILFKVPLRVLLLVSYGIIFVLAYFSDPNYLSVAFDAGGVTTGPMTAPFIIAMGVGVASIRSDREAENDSFGLVALCSVGPILAVLLLGFFYKGEAGAISAENFVAYDTTVSIGRAYLAAIPHYMKEVAVALLPVVGFFLAFQFWQLKLPRSRVKHILAGLLATYAGLVLFLTGVNVGFSALGLLLGEELAQGWTAPLLIPIAALMGYFIVAAEPAVHTLTKQVEEVSAGAISRRAMRAAMSVAIAGALALSAARAWLGFDIMWIVGPGYLISLALTAVVPQLFTAIAFDAGGVASGPMSATFMLPFMMGISPATGGNILTDAFGTVAFVSLMPLITIQILGVAAIIRARIQAAKPVSAPVYSDTEVIELW